MTSRPLTFEKRIMKFSPYLLAFVAIFLAFACSNAATGSSSGETITGEVNQREPLRLEPAEEEKAKPALALRMGTAKAAQGARVCLPVETTGLTQLLGFQFTMRFDSAALRFETFRAINLPGYSSSNFGTRFADRGYLSTLWSDPSLQSVSMPAGHKIFEVCFTNLMDKGQSAEVKFQDGPTYFEVVGADMKPRRLVYANGKVTSK